MTRRSHAPLECFIAVFQGMHQEECSKDYELALIAAFTEKMEEHHYRVFSKCFTAPLAASPTSKKVLRHWADYSEVHEPYEESTDVPAHAEQLQASMKPVVWDWVEEQVQRGRDGVFIGCSNGGIAAAEMALYVRSRLRHSYVPLVFLSSLPANQQMKALEATYAHEPGRVLFTRGSRDRNWTHEKYYNFASRLLADVKTYAGGHSHETEELMRKVGRRAAKELLGK